MHKFLIQILTGKDNKTYDLGRFLWAISVITYLSLSLVAVIQGQPWHPLEFGGGLSAALAGGGIGIAVKSHTEPEGQD